MIKTYTQKDEQKLKQLIISTNSEIDLIEIPKNPNYVSSFLSYMEDEIVGWIVAWKSSFHPHCTYFRIVIQSENHDSFIQLLDALEDSLTEKDYPLLTGVDGGKDLSNYYQKNNFEIIRETYLPTIKLSNVELLPFKTHDIKTVREIRHNHLLVNELTRLVKNVYEETHLVNPVAEFDLETWEELIFAEDLLLDGSFIYLNDNDEVLSYSFLHKSEEENKVELGWIGSRSKSYIQSLHTLVSLQINYAKQNNYQYLEGEFDTTDPYAMEVLHKFQFPKETVWITYSKKER
ncbi:hypothetical protein [Ornithinibacillus halotolerans]|uniref:Uncharacterized protein n=1 Tax=Ornithinibacillus halotolerans TaxID=1274357 RepID=A0A916S228_9BACI|nr:hypothetical protein [Ornithinibacillus halotolerans]GGA80854.1 hypothetical protein GCM10008025_25290 [Ornithinibacillus halotolerans]